MDLNTENNTLPVKKVRKQVAQAGETTIARPKILGLKQVLAKQYDFLPNLADKIIRSFGLLVSNFGMIIWGPSGNGKTNLIMQLCDVLSSYGDVLYVSLEEGTEATMQMLIQRTLNAETHSGKIKFADASMTYDNLVWQLSKKQQAQFIVIDSVQYFDINYQKYKKLKERFPKKTFIYISHAKGQYPLGNTANAIRYDSGIKVRVEGCVAFIISRYANGPPIPYVIWEDGAKKYWGDNYKTVITGGKPKKTKKSKPKKEKAPVKKEETTETVTT